MRHTGNGGRIRKSIEGKTNMSKESIVTLIFLVFFAGGLSGVIIGSTISERVQKEAIISGIIIGRITTRSDMQKEAIKADVAEWQTNPKTGETKFTWIKVEK